MPQRPNLIDVTGSRVANDLPGVISGLRCRGQTALPATGQVEGGGGLNGARRWPDGAEDAAGDCEIADIGLMRHPRWPRQRDVVRAQDLRALERLDLVPSAQDHRFALASPRPCRRARRGRSVAARTAPASVRALGCAGRVAPHGWLRRGCGRRDPRIATATRSLAAWRRVSPRPSSDDDAAPTYLVKYQYWGWMNPRALAA